MLIRSAWILRVILVSTIFLAAACQPVRPLTPTPAAAEAAAVTPAAAPIAPAAPAAGSIAGRYTGKLAIAGLNLDVVVNLVEEGGVYSGTIDIPQQGATGLPLHDVTFAPPAVHIEFLTGPQAVKLDGEVGADGSIQGKMTQSGYEGTFALTPQAQAAAPAAPGLPAPTILPAGVERIYTDPANRFLAPVPTGWTVTEKPGYLLLTDPENLIKVYILVSDETDPAIAIAEAWQQVDPTFAFEIDQSVTPPSAPGIEKTVVNSYKTGDPNRLLQGMAQLKNGVNYINLYDVQAAGVQKRAAQLSIVTSGFQVLGNEQADLSNARPLTVTAEITGQLETFIDKYMQAFQIPGAAVGIVQDGKLVYAQGFGIANPETGAPVTPDTRMMIGSTGKSLTTMLMATLVDDKLMKWDTPVVQLFPSFKVKDPDLTQKITMRNLVCACTGVPRRDMEWLFNFHTLTPTDTIASLATFDFYTKFGEAFQYSNQMVATAGYIAGQVAENNNGDLAGDYAKALQERVLGPIGMISTTLSFDEVMRDGNYATPHTQMLDATYQPMSLDLERSLEAVGPAGAHWSTLNDMARYMITQLADGAAPDNSRVVSAQNLNVTRQPQIAINANTSYGLGWMVTRYKGQPVITHAGNTLGFTSEFTFLPKANLGVIVLTNARASNTFNGGITSRLLELVFEQEPRVEQELDFMLTQIAKQAAEVKQRMSAPLDEQAVQSHLGTFTNPVLGDVTVSLADGKLLLDAGEFKTQLLPYNDPASSLSGFVQIDPPGQGLLYRFEQDAAGAPVIILGQASEQYTFTKKS